MNKTIPTLAAVLAMLSVAQPAQSAIKCWTNKEGVRECGEKVPPEYAQKGHQELSEQGTVIEEQERALTAEEIAEQKRKAEEEAERRRIAEEKERQDQILLATFSSVEEIERVRDDQISALEARMSTTISFKEKIQEQLKRKMEAAAAEERAGNPPSDTLRSDIDSLKRQLKNNEDSIASLKREQEQTRKDYADRISRFKELKGIAGGQ